MIAELTRVYEDPVKLARTASDVHLGLAVETVLWEAESKRIFYEWKAKAIRS